MLCELMMPGVSGIEFYERLRALDPVMSAGVVFMTGGALTDQARAFLARLPNRHLRKPLSIADLETLFRMKEAGTTNRSPSVLNSPVG